MLRDSPKALAPEYSFPHLSEKYFFTLDLILSLRNLQFNNNTTNNKAQGNDCFCQPVWKGTRFSLKTSSGCHQDIQQIIKDWRRREERHAGPKSLGYEWMCSRQGSIVSMRGLDRVTSM